MNKKILRMMVIAGATLITSFLLTGIVHAMTMDSEDDLSQVEIEDELYNKGFIKVDTLEQASQIAGYQVASPTFLPDYLRHNDVCISVYQLGDCPTRPIIQTWSSNDGEETRLHLISDPKVTRIAGGGEPTLVANSLGERACHGSEYGLSKPMLCLFWRADDTTYTLCGNINFSLDEETMYKIANSVVDNKK
jgi:hypothetical protein